MSDIAEKIASLIVAMLIGIIVISIVLIVISLMAKILGVVWFVFFRVGTFIKRFPPSGGFYAHFMSGMEI